MHCYEVGMDNTTGQSMFGGVLKALCSICVETTHAQLDNTAAKQGNRLACKAARQMQQTANQQTQSWHTSVDGSTGRQCATVGGM
jgi:hypothetical protein